MIKNGGMQSCVRAIGSVLQDKLNIPVYQRPYRWSEKHVSQLIQDIIHHQDKSSYRLGTVVVHDKDGKLDIVDGQQRLLTLSLTVAAMKSRLPKIDVFKLNLEHGEFKNNENDFLQSMLITNTISIENLKHNSVIIDQKLANLAEDELDKLAHFLVNACTVVFITLNDLSEAFQFFDSQNARGKSLEPYDLLKAYHLREMEHEPEQVQIDIIEKWENEAKEGGALKEIFDDYLFRIKKWLKHEEGRYFTKDDVDLFKGLNPDDKNLPPYFLLYKMSHHITDDYNQDNVRKIDEQHLTYPFAINQVVLNGRRFFEATQHYVNILKQLEDHPDLKEYFVFSKQDGYTGEGRKGDQYVKNLFKCVLMFYFDKFGEARLKQAGLLCFLWAYSLRINLQTLQLASMDNHALSSKNLFFKINNAIYSKDVFSFIVTPLTACRATKMGKIKQIFIDNKLLPNDK
ncbi:DUF262 domain-containing protein [Colwellia psychrerythraea]|uniref:Uncharacterized protein n=1 Tax=Colwellia psychrerythraea TaxID=28229 RepID=A0A099KSZ0_COLPS|nr:DUF262 domain-containing protein [Colwellia psychrerythraea]KGJ93606.1 protein of unknown function DUF262 [Colwellia psychrerythraea]